jgi:hypothetical protein
LKVLVPEIEREEGELRGRIPRNEIKVIGTLCQEEDEKRKQQFS